MGAAHISEFVRIILFSTIALGGVLPHVRAEPFLPTADQLDILPSAPGGPLGNGLDSLDASFPSECMQLAQLRPFSPGPGNRQLTEVQMDTITAGVTDVCQGFVGSRLKHSWPKPGEPGPTAPKPGP